MSVAADGFQASGLPTSTHIVPRAIPVGSGNILPSFDKSSTDIEKFCTPINDSLHKQGVRIA
eukprot:1106433-Rhodomonas_salina.1